MFSCRDNCLLVHLVQGVLKAQEVVVQQARPVHGGASARLQMMRTHLHLEAASSRRGMTAVMTMMERIRMTGALSGAASFAPAPTLLLPPTHPQQAAARPVAGVVQPKHLQQAAAYLLAVPTGRRGHQGGCLGV
jgi:hypothetical protein